MANIRHVVRISHNCHHQLSRQSRNLINKRIFVCGNGRYFSYIKCNTNIICKRFSSTNINIKPIRSKSVFFIWFKRILSTVGGSIFLLISWLYYNHHDEENWKRSLYFWSKLYPIYIAYRYTDFKTKNWDQNDRDNEFEKLHEKYKTKIYDIAIHLQGFYIKLGQLGAARTDVVPIQWVELLRKLEDECPYHSFDIIENIIKKDFNISNTNQIFEYIHPKPIGSASIGQTHYARLKNGEEVVLKVQYQNVEKLFRGDFKMARKFCEMAQPAHLPFLDETEKQFLTEFDYRLEAKNLELIASNLNNNPLWKDKVIVPEPYKDLCTKYVLTMKYLKGKKLITALKDNFTSIAKERGLTLNEFVEEQKQLKFHPTAQQMKSIHNKLIIRDKIWNFLAICCNYSFGFLYKLLGNSNIHIVPYRSSVLPLNTKLILDLVSSVHGYELFIDGAFNGDPHPGNILLLNDGRLGLIDYGQVKHLSVKQRIEFAKLITYLYDDNSEYIVKQMTENMGFQTKFMNDYVIEKSARFYFDSDSLDVTEGMNAQLFLEYLNHKDPVVQLSDEYVMVGRLKLLLSGLFYSLGYEFSAAKEWNHWAQIVLDNNNIDPYNT